MRSEDIKILKTFRQSLLADNDLQKKLLLESRLSHIEHLQEDSSRYHIHQALEMRLLFTADKDDSVNYQELEELRIIAPETLHLQLSIKDNLRHITCRCGLNEIYLVIGLANIIVIDPAALESVPGLDYRELYFALNLILKEDNSDIDYIRIVIASVLTLIINHLRETKSHNTLTHADMIAACIRANYYRQDLSINEIAEMSKLSPGYIQTVFRAKWKCTPIQYLNEVRLNAARTILQTQDFSVHEVAAMCGWRYPHYFSRKYREHFGCLPTEETRRSSGKK